MKTDKKTMAEIWREIENNPDAEIETNAEYVGWVRFTGVLFNPKKYSYRIKPKTITLSNGVEIPEPLSEKTVEINQGMNFYIPMCSESLSECVGFSWVRNFKPKFVYLDEDKAVEASKALFGLL